MALTQEQLEKLKMKYNPGSMPTSYGVEGEEATPSNIHQKIQHYKKMAGMRSDDEITEALDVPEKEGFFKRLGDDLKKRGKGILETWRETVAGEITPLETGLRTVGGVAGGLGDVLGQVMVSGFRALPDIVEDPLRAKGRDILESEVGQLGMAALQQGFEAYDEWRESHPRAAKSLEATINIAEWIPIGKGAGLAFKGAKRITPPAKAIAELPEKGIKQIKKVRTDKAISQVDDLVGTIAQGKKAELPKVKRALKDLDTEGVKTYSQLRERVDEKIKVISKEVDDYLTKEAPKPLKLNKMITKTKVNDKVVYQNFALRALDDMAEMYTKIGDDVNATKYIEMKNKAEGTGLTLKDYNQLSRDYNTTFGNKAFSKTGDPLTSVNAVKYENTRKGLKNSIRNKIETDTPKELDASLSELYTTQRLVKKMEERVQTLAQKVQKRNIFQKVAGGLAGVVDIATLGAPKAFIMKLFIPSNVGMKTLNALDLDKALKKNLDKLRKINKMDDEKIAKEVIKEIKKKPDQVVAKEVVEEIPAPSPKPIRRMEAVEEVTEIPEERIARETVEETVEGIAPYIEKEGRSLIEWSNEDLTLPELRRKLLIAVDQDVDDNTIKLIREEIKIRK